jgi:hypothetical protein
MAAAPEIVVIGGLLQVEKGGAANFRLSRKRPTGQPLRGSIAITRLAVLKIESTPSRRPGFRRDDESNDGDNQKAGTKARRFKKIIAEGA